MHDILFEIYQGGLSEGYKKYITDNELPDGTYTEDGVALFRVQGSGPDNMQAIQVDLVCMITVSYHTSALMTCSCSSPISNFGVLIVIFKYKFSNILGRKKERIVSLFFNM